MKKKKTLPPGFLKQVREDRKQILAQEKHRLIAQGRSMRKRHDQLRDTLNALKMEREAQGVSLGELSKRTGISKASLSRLENHLSPNPTVATLSRIAQALGRQIKIHLTHAA